MSDRVMKPFLIILWIYQSTAISTSNEDFGKTINLRNIVSSEKLATLINGIQDKNYFDLNLIISGSSFKNFGNIDEYFERYIKRINIIQNGTEVSQDAFYNFKNLYILSFYEGDIKILTGFKLSPYNNNFNFILNLKKNGIEQIVKICPNGFRVEKILLDHNDLESFEEKNIGECLGTKFLDLSFNKLKSIDANILNTFDVLDKLDLGYNKIGSFTNNYRPRRYFTGEKYKFSSIDLRVLNLNDNNLETFNDDSFKYFVKLEVLNLENNPFLKLQGDIFKGMDRLSHLNLRNLKYFDRKTLKQLGGLISLNTTFDFFL